MKLFITGGSRGIGRAILETLAPDCDSAVVLGRDKQHLAAVTEDFADGINDLLTIHSDLADLNATQHAIREWGATQDSLDVLVLSGGLFTEGDLDKMPLGTFEHDLRVNLSSTFVIAQELIPLLQRGTNPRIVIIGSTAAYEPYPLVPSYGVAKWGLRGLAINLREQLRDRRIGVCFVSPGATWTDMWAGEDLPKNRLLFSEDVARVVKTCVTLSEQAVIEDVIVRPIEGDMHG